MSHVLQRGPGTLPVAVGGERCHVIDSTGKRYLDASGGAAVSCLGHGHPRVIAAIQAQAAAMAYAHTGFFTNEPMEALADLLIADAPAGIDKAYFVSGGSEATESALKLARQYFVEIGQPQRRHFIARRQSYHGNTLGALAAGGNEWRRRQFAPLLIETHHIAPCYAYRDPPRGRERGRLRPARRGRAGAEDPGSRPRDGHRLHRRADRGCHRWARFPPSPAISSASARSATAMACC